MGHLEHKAQSPAVANCYILTISDTRTEATDSSGRAIFDLLWAGGHQVAGRKIVRDEPDQVAGAIREQLASPHVQVVITTGGTGITSRDTTFEAIDALLEKRLDGFGELFRMLSFHEIGSAAMMSRACAGVVADQHGSVERFVYPLHHRKRLGVSRYQTDPRVGGCGDDIQHVRAGRQL